MSDAERGRFIAEHAGEPELKAFLERLADDLALFRSMDPSVRPSHAWLAMWLNGRVTALEQLKSRLQ